MTLDEILAVYFGRNADATKALYGRLLDYPPRGLVAVNLLRTARNSEMAKSYKTRRSSAAAYDTKDWSISELCRAMRDHPEVIASWGWARDERSTGFEDVLYVDIPGTGQVSFHSSSRRDGPDYAGKWDGVRQAAPRRICRWVEAIFDGREVETQQQGGDDDVHAGTERAATQGDERGAPRPEEKQETLDL